MGLVDKQDSIGVCVDCESGSESLQRNQAVCISTNGKHMCLIPYPLLALLNVDLIVFPSLPSPQVQCLSMEKK